MNAATLSASLRVAAILWTSGAVAAAITFPLLAVFVWLNAVSLWAGLRLFIHMYKADPDRFRHLAAPAPFVGMFRPGRLEAFLKTAELDEDPQIRGLKDDCRVWLGRYADWLPRLAWLAAIYTLLTLVWAVAAFLQ